MNAVPALLPVRCARLLACGWLLLAAVNAFSGAWGQVLAVTPDVAMTDEVVSVRATGLQPGETVSLRAELTDGGGHAWRAEAVFTADAQGAVDASQQAPVKGSYRDVSAMGLVWSMRPEGNDALIFQPARDFAPEKIRLTLLRDGKSLARADLERRVLAEGVKAVRVNGAIQGVLFRPAGEKPHPGVLVLGGSEGGAPVRRAAWLASHGYTALALAYFLWPGLPDQLRDIPLEYIGKGLGWLMQQPGVAKDQIAVMGGSRGGELALQAGSIFPDVKAVVAFVPANVRVQACCDGRGGGAWTLGGQELAYAAMGAHEMQPSKAAEIAVEQIHGPVLLVSGKSDGVWDSTGMTDAVVRRLKAQHFAYPVENLQYAHAGHRAGASEIYPTWHGTLRHPVSGRLEDLGGTPEGDAASDLAAGPRVLLFLQRSFPAETKVGTGAPM